LRKAFKLNSIIDAKVIEIDPKRGEPRLSIRELADDEERRATREYRQKLTAQGGFGTLGDLFRNKLSGG
jgi:small subunit ribosomal protein S1